MTGGRQHIDHRAKSQVHSITRNGGAHLPVVRHANQPVFGNRDFGPTGLMHPQAAMGWGFELFRTLAAQKMNGGQPILEVLNHPRKTVAVGAKRQDIKSIVHKKVNRLILGHPFRPFVGPGDFISILAGQCSRGGGQHPGTCRPRRQVMRGKVLERVGGGVR